MAVSEAFLELHTISNPFPDGDVEARTRRDKQSAYKVLKNRTVDVVQQIGHDRKHECFGATKRETFPREWRPTITGGLLETSPAF
jgi:hypothetical protein